MPRKSSAATHKPAIQKQHLKPAHFFETHDIPKATGWLMIRRGEFEGTRTEHGLYLPAKLEDALIKPP